MTATWSGSPATWATGTLVTATQLNAELRDRMDYLKLRMVEDHYIHIRDEKSSGTAGGTFTSGAWQTRDLNTEVSDTGSHASLSSNQITLAAGKYLAHIRCPAYAVDQNRARLQNVTDGTTLLTSESAYARFVSGGSHTIFAEIRGLFTLAASKVLEVQHRGTTTSATSGFGIASSLATEIYTSVELIRIGD